MNHNTNDLTDTPTGGLATPGAGATSPTLEGLLRDLAERPDP